MFKNNSTRRKSARGSSRRRGAGSGLRKFANIESVVVEEPFSLLQPSSTSINRTRSLVASASPSSDAQNDSSEAKKAGEGCFVSATVQNKRYYGVLIDQSSLKEASELWFHDEETSLNLNRRMKILKSHQQKDNLQEEQAQEDDGKDALLVGHSSHADSGSLTPHLNIGANGTAENPTVFVTKEPSPEDSDSSRAELKRPAVDDVDDPDKSSAKRVKVGESVEAVVSSSGTKPGSPSALEAEQVERAHPPSPFKMTQPNRQVQKFRYVEQGAQDTGYRILLATFADVLTAANDDHSLALDIQGACDEGGQFVRDDHYYQYEVHSTTLDARYETKRTKEHGIRTSMGFHSFLNNTALPDWFPLSNLQLGQQRKVWSMLNLKRGKKSNTAQTSTDTLQPNAVPSSVNDGTMVNTVPSATNDEMLMITSGTDLPMKQRPKPRFQIGVIGGGIAGLCKWLSPST